MPNLDVTPPSIEQVALFSTIDRLQQRNVLLQRELDSQGENLLTNVLVTSISDAIRLRDNYNLPWFKRALYSPAVKAKIAQRLLDAVKGYSFIIDTSIWTELAGGSK